MSEVELGSQGDASGFIVDFISESVVVPQDQQRPCRCKLEQFLLPDGQLLDMNTDTERERALKIARTINNGITAQEPYRIG
jgi:hypothetical protein